MKGLLHGLIGQKQIEYLFGEMIKFATMEAKNFKFKYYNGEEENPFTDDGNASLWWDGERLFYETITAPGGDSFIKRLRDNYDDALARGGLSGEVSASASNSGCSARKARKIPSRMSFGTPSTPRIPALDACAFRRSLPRIAGV